MVREDRRYINKLSKPEKPGEQPRMMALMPVRRAAVLAIRRMVKAEMLIESYVTAAAVQGWEFPYPDPPAPAGGQ